MLKLKKQRFSWLRKSKGLFAQLRFPHLSKRIVVVGVASFVVVAVGLYYLFLPRAGYSLSAKALTLLPTAQSQLAASLKEESKSFEYNKDYTPSTEVGGDISSPRFSASFSKNAKDGFSTKDATNNIALTVKPNFAVETPKATDNRVVYPITGRDAQAVYTLQVTRVKEDIVLNRAQGDSLQFSYTLSLPEGTEARVEASGAVGVYGVDSSLLGDVSTGTDADAALLKKARENGEKNTLLFTIPAPFVKEYGKASTSARAWFGLSGPTLTVYATDLENLSYPVSIDPSIYIDSAAQLMIGNNESNIDFDVDNQLIEKGKTTGGRFDSWIDSLTLPAARWGHATTVAGGYIYAMGGNNGTTSQGNLYWGHLNTSTGDIEAPTPGDSSCASWCTNSVYDLPSSAVRNGASLVAYNGYLYLFGGLDGSNAKTSTVFIAKIGANGEPQLWHPTDSNKANWVYWYSDTAMSSARSYVGAVAYNNRMYLIGGSSSATPNGVTTVEKADISPTGVLTNWTSVTSLGTGLYGMGVQVYNDRLYVIGGANGTTTQSAVYYTKINSDGTLNSWLTATAIGNGVSGGARATLGGTMTTVWGGYIYVAGGCASLSGTSSAPYCTSLNTASDIQLASINADGSITDWTTVLGVTSARTNYGFVSWRNRLYAIGGCTSQTSSGTCASTSTSSQYGAINPDGDVSTVSTSVASGTAPCDATNSYYNCDLPPEGDSSGQSGRMSGGAVINNGYIYYMGGCTAVANNSVCYTGNSGKSTDNISYAAIDSVGHITRASSCSGTWVGSWCNYTSSPQALGAKVSAFAYTVFNNTLYVIGGTTGTDWQSNIWRTTFNSDGTWGAWSSQTFAATGLGNAKGYQYAFTRANPSQASTYPGNLYVLGGCSGVTSTDNGLDCTGTTYTEVYKCYIKTDGSLETTGSTCTTSGQLQIDSEPGTSGSQGLGVMAGTVYANYIYLIGGQSPNEGERGEVMYAKIDNSNNIVDAQTGSSSGIWTFAASGPGSDNTWRTSDDVLIQLSPVRRRGIAFGYNGYLYALAGYNVSAGGSLNDLLYAKINVSDGSIAPFTTSHVTVTARWDLRGAINNGYVYAIGGCSVGQPPASCSTMTGTIQTFQLYNNYSGSPKLYSSGNQFTTDRYGASATVLNGYVYLAGGCTTAATDCTTATTSVQYAQIQADGTLGSWSATSQSLPTALSWGQLESVGGTLYYIGGQTGGSNNGTTTVYWTTPSSSTGNTTAAWQNASNVLPAARTQHGATVWNNRIYVVGGNDGSGNATNTVYVSPQLNSGGDITSAWSTSSTSFNVARSGSAVLAYANNLYIFGGYTGTYYLNDVQYSQISSSTGLAGSWSYSTSLPSALREADAVAANGFIYIFGGRSNATTCTSNTIVAPISANTTIATGNNPTGIGEWYATNIRYSGNRYGATAVYNEGKAFVMGGQCNGTMITTTNKVQYSTLQSQPQLARYSRMIDTDTDVFPTKWLMNGLDNSIGARWYLRYRSMTNPFAASGQECTTPAMTSWGQEYYYGQITLGLPDTYTPYNGSGTNTNCARYYYLSVNIDSSQAYGYPEDVSRGPTITDLSLFFTADPSKRLMHGRTFTGGVQQPDDTPF